MSADPPVFGGVQPVGCDWVDAGVLSLTPGLPSLSAMNSIPESSNAKPIMAIASAETNALSHSKSMTVLAGKDVLMARAPQLQFNSNRAALHCAGTMT